MEASIPLARTHPERLAALRDAALLDTPPEEAFDRLVRLAASLLGVPAAFISLVEEGRDFYKAQCGFGEPLASRRELEGETFCHHTIAAEGPLVIADTRASPVFRGLPTVESLGVAAYVGIPIRGARGHVLGAFCAIDSRPRDWAPAEVDVLAELARSAEREIQLREAVREFAVRAEEARSSTRRLEEELERRTALAVVHTQMYGEAQAAVRARDEALAVVAHDLRDPVSTIFMSASLLLELPLPEPRRRRHLEIIKRTAARANRQIQDLLDVGRIEAGRLSVMPAPVAVAELAAEVGEWARPKAEEAGQEFACAVPDGLPDVLADHSRVIQALTNLIGNALKFTPAGGRVELRADRNGEAVRFSVADTGPGIAEEHLPYLFTRFWQARPGDRRGAGLGLAIVQGIVEAHGGSVEVRSTPGEGSTFSLTLPLAPASGVEKG
jgi:signal transduction histidine kinase